MTNKDNNKEVNKSLHRRFEGVVVSVKENKTIRVAVRTVKIHPKYKKQYATSKKYAVHDEHGKAKVGNVVLFEECRPISKTKHCTLVKVINSGIALEAID